MKKFIDQQRSIPTKDFNLLVKIQLDTRKWNYEGPRADSYYGQVFIYRKEIDSNYLVLQTLCYPNREIIEKQIDAFIKDNFII